MTKAKTVKVTKKPYDTADAAARLTGLLPSRVVGKVTARQQDLMNFDKIISKNKAMFKVGTVLSRADFVNLFNLNVNPNPKAKGTYKKLQSDNLELVGAQRTVNDVLNHNGLHVKSRDYYSEFHVCVKDITKATIARHSARIERLEARQGILEANTHQRVKVDKKFGKILRVFASSGAIVRPLPVRAKPATINSTAKTHNRMQFV